MKSVSRTKCLFLWLGALSFCANFAFAGSRGDLGKIMQTIGLAKDKDAPVKVSIDEDGLLYIKDTGDFISQYMIAGVEASADPNVIISADMKIPSTADKVLIVTHGWIDKGANDWPADIVHAISEKTDPNEWVCGIFDWKGGAAVVSPVDAAKYGRDIAGPRLVKALSTLPNRFEHVHLIGHSAGSWTVNSAMKLVAEKYPLKSLHVTFLDAYVPPFWKTGDLAKFQKETPKATYVEHYYTKDFTLEVTHADLPNALNVDITAIDPWFKEHEFPYRWYYASITGRFGRFDEKKSDVVTSADGVEYGFKRSLQAGQDRFAKSLKLDKENNPIKLRVKKKGFNLNFFRKR